VLLERSERLVQRAQQHGAIRPDVTAVEVMQLVSGVSYACAAARAVGKSSRSERLVGIVMDGLRAQPRVG